MYGTTVYMHNKTTDKMTLMMTKSRLANTKLAGKTIPQLELQAILLGVQSLVDLYDDLAGDSCTRPIIIESLYIYSDSLVALNWVRNYCNKFVKTQKLSIFVNNRIAKIYEYCQTREINFRFISGCSNPADVVTRDMSHKLLMKTNYVSGPAINDDLNREHSSEFTFTVPSTDLIVSNTFVSCTNVTNVVDCNRFSDFNKVALIYLKVRRFIDSLKRKLFLKDPVKYQHLNVVNSFNIGQAKYAIIKSEQEKAFPEMFSYFSRQNASNSEIPEIVNKFNAYIDAKGMIRVKSKFDRVDSLGQRCNFPLLLPRDAHITRMIIETIHRSFNHAGCYTIISQVRKQFFIPQIFSLIKTILRDCVNCKRYSGRTVKINQSPYRFFRSNPPKIPFSTVFMDYFGPFKVKRDKNNVKVYVLLITCMWTRAVSLQISNEMTADEFMRSFQMHTLKWGVPQYCVSDLGSNFTSSINTIKGFINNSECDTYFRELGSKPLKFDQYFKGNSSLGSMVEVLVKLCKQLIYKTIKTNVIDIREFEMLICETENIINKRPIAFLESLRQDDIEVPETITPEIIVHGYELPCINLVPNFQPNPDVEMDPDFQLNPVDQAKSLHQKFKKVRKNLSTVYHKEFIAKLIYQAVDRSSRYKPVTHDKISVGDVVLLVEDNTKRVNYPLAVVTKCFENDLGEVTNIMAKKAGKTVKRHVTSIIHLLSTDKLPENNLPNDVKVREITPRSIPRRAAAITSANKTKAICNDL